MNNKGKHLGELIRKRREELGLTQDQLASLVVSYHKTAYQYISNCERGKSSLSPKYFAVLLRALELDKKELLEAYCLDYIDMILVEAVKNEKLIETIEKRKKTRKETEDKDFQNRIESAKDAWKMLGLENL